MQQHRAAFQQIKQSCDDYTIWQIDTEFRVVKGTTPVVFTLTASEFLSNRIVVSTAVDYGAMPL
jgi:hypothetical protein